MSLTDPLFRILFFRSLIQWPLLVAVRQASYPESRACCALPEDLTAEEVPQRLLALWWESSSQRDLPGCSVQDAEVKVIALLLEKSKVVEKLNLTNNLIGPAELQVLCSALSTKTSTLLELFLDGNPLGPDG